MKKYLLVLLVVNLMGCATLFGDKERTVRVDSKPSGATVLLNGMPYGKTPTTIQIQNMLSANTISFKLEGYDEIARPIATSIQPIAFLNLINLICWGIDFATGNVMKIDTKMINVDLEKKTAQFQNGLNHFTVNLEDLNQCPNS